MAGTTEAQCTNHKRLLSTENKLEGLLQSMETINHGNDKIMTAYHELRDENTALKAAVQDLTRQIMNQSAMPTPPLPTTDAITSSTMVEMSLQISDIQCNIQDVRDAVRNPAGNRKCSPSNTYTPNDAQPTSPTADRPTA
jgi:hypothetical protein